MMHMTYYRNTKKVKHLYLHILTYSKKRYALLIVMNHEICMHQFRELLDLQT